MQTAAGTHTCADSNRPMRTSSPAFSSPIVCIDEFLPEATAQRVLNECIALKEEFVPARIYDGPGTPRIERTFRRNDVVYMNDLYGDSPERSYILSVLREFSASAEMLGIWREGEFFRNVIGHASWREAVLSRYGNCDFYHRHQDTRRDRITSRLVTLVYYVNTIPERFTGGALLFSDGDNRIRIAPKHNRAVVFLSSTFHEVENVRIGSQRWEDGRFSVNYWMGFA